jgi:hypothetical protein
LDGLPIDFPVTSIAAIIAVLALLFSVASVLMSLGARRARLRSRTRILSKETDTKQYQQTEFLPEPDLIVEIERTSPNGSTEVFRLQPDDEQSIRSFLREANSLKHESAHASAR